MDATQIFRNPLFSNEELINKLLNSPVGESLNNIIAAIENINKIIDCFDADEEEKKLIETKAVTIALITILRKKAEGKDITEFKDEDWKDIVGNVAEFAIFMPGDQYSICVFELFEKYILKSAEIIKEFIPEKAYDAIVGLADELHTNMDMFQNGEVDEVRFTEDSLWIALEAMFKLLQAYFVSFVKNETVAEFSNALSDFAFEYGRLMMYKREQVIYTELVEAQYVLDEELKEKYICYVEELKKQTEQFFSLIESAFVDNYREAFLKSVMLAQMAGVNEEQILKCKEDMDSFFLD